MQRIAGTGDECGVLEVRYTTNATAAPHPERESRDLLLKFWKMGQQKADSSTGARNDHVFTPGAYSLRFSASLLAGDQTLVAARLSEVHRALSNANSQHD